MYVLALLADRAHFWPSVAALGAGSLALTLLALSIALWKRD